MRRVAMVVAAAGAVLVGGCETFEAQGPRAAARSEPRVAGSGNPGGGLPGRPRPRGTLAASLIASR